MEKQINFEPDAKLIKKLSGNIEEKINYCNKIRNVTQVVIILSIIINLTLLVIYIIKCIRTGSILDISKWLTFIILFVPFITVTIHNRLSVKVKGLRRILVRTRKSYRDGSKMNDILLSKLDFCLYLRDFSSGENETERTPIPGGLTGFANPALWDIRYGKATSKIIIKYFEKFSPIILLNNVEEMTVLDGGLTIYSDNKTWKIYFKKLVNNAKIIVIDYQLNFDFSNDNNNLTNNIKFEIEYIISLGVKNIILIGTKEEIEFICNKYTSFKKLIIAYCLKSKNSDNFNQKTIDFSETDKVLSKIF